MDCEPLVALAPDQAPEAVQAVALLADQASGRGCCRSRLRACSGSRTKLTGRARAR